MVFMEIDNNVKDQNCTDFYYKDFHFYIIYIKKCNSKVKKDPDTITLNILFVYLISFAFILFLQGDAIRLEQFLR